MPMDPNTWVSHHPRERVQRDHAYPIYRYPRIKPTPTWRRLWNRWLLYLDR